jgi:hypothetical protein
MHMNDKKLEIELGYKQAVIDSLMLEYCPEEMTEHQITEWEKHQRRVSIDETK